MARYWRMTSILTWSGTLELSEAQLYEGGSPVAVTPTASVAPNSGNLADLVDALATASVVWSGAMPTLVWDTAGLTAPDLRLGAGTSEDAYPVDLILQSSDDALYWTTYASIKSLAYPGDWTLTADLGSGQTDPYFSNVSLLLLANGTHGSTAITDSSTDAHTVTPYGNTSTSTTNSHSGGSSLYFDGAGDYLTLVGANAFHFSTLDFTWESWVRRSTVVNGDFDVIWGPSNGPRGIGVTLRNAGQVGVWVSSTGASWDVRRGDTNWGAAVIPLNTWVHLAVVRSGSTWYGLVDGVVDQTFTHAGAVSAYDANIHICRWDGGYTQHFNGYIDDLRVTKGVARYTSAFTPPTAYGGGGFSLSPGPRKYGVSTLAPNVLQITGAELPALSASGHLPEFTFSDPIYGGQHQIVGTVKEKSTPTNKPLPRRVVLIDERAQLAVRETWSDAAGNYQFYGIRGDLRYTVISYDYSGTYRAVIADNLIPEATT